MRITPARWDAEYAWLRKEEGVTVWQAEPKVQVKERSHRTVKWTLSRPSTTGLAFQAIGAFVLGLLAINGQMLTLLPLAVLVGGEVIFISSLEHKGERSAGDH